MATTLVNLYHGRIKYPWQRDADAKDGPKDAEKTPLGPVTPPKTVEVDTPATDAAPKTVRAAEASETKSTPG